MPNDCQNFSLEQLGPFLTDHPGRGTVRVQVTTADGAFPIADAAVEISAVMGGTALPLYRRKTNASGIAGDFVLPAKPRFVSQREETADGSGTLYTVTVTKAGFRPLTDRRVVIYDGVETIFPAALQPLMT